MSEHTSRLLSLNEPALAPLRRTDLASFVVSLSDSKILLATPPCAALGIESDVPAPMGVKSVAHRLGEHTSGTPRLERVRVPSSFVPHMFSCLAVNSPLGRLVVFADPQAVVIGDTPAPPKEPSSPAPAVPEATRPVRFTWEADAQGRLSALSRSFLDALAPRLRSWQGRTFADLASDGVLKDASAISALLTDGASFSDTVLWTGEDPARRIEIGGVPLFDGAKRRIGVRGFGLIWEAPPRPAQKEPEAARNVVPLRAGALNARERSAFHEIARTLNDAIDGWQKPAPLSPEPPTEPAKPATESIVAPTSVQPIYASPPPPRGVDEGLLDRLPIGLMIQQDGEMVHANATLLGWVGVADIEAFRAIGGLTPRLDRLSLDGPLELQSVNGTKLPVEARLVSTTWRGQPAIVHVVRTIEVPAAVPEPPPPPPPAPPRGVDDALLDGLPVGLVVQQRGETVHVNSTLLNWAGVADLDAFRASGGLSPRLNRRSADGPLEIESLAGGRQPVEVKLVPADWRGQPAIVHVVRTVELPPPPPPPPAPPSGLDDGLLDGLPIGLAVQQRGELVHVNATLLTWTGVADTGAFRNSGGLSPRLSRPSPDGPLELETSGGNRIPVEARLLSSTWKGQPAIVHLVRIIDAPPPPPPVQVALPAVDIGAVQAKARSEALDVIPFGVLLLDYSGAIEDMNIAAAALCGFRSSELQGEPFTLLFASGSQTAAVSLLDQAAEAFPGAAPGQAKVTLRHRLGAETVMEATLVRATEAPPRFCLVLRDAPAELSGPTSHMERPVHRAAQIDEEAAMAQAMEPFVRRISHAVRVPLTSILGFVDAVRSSTFGPVGNSRYSKQAEAAVAAGLQLLASLEDIEQLIPGEFDGGRETVDVKGLVQEAIDHVAPSARRRRILIRQDAMPPLEAWFNAPALSRIVRLLLEEGVRATPAGGQVIISARQDGRDTGAEGVVIMIRDGGLGLTEEEIAQALSPTRAVMISDRFSAAGQPFRMARISAALKANGGELRLRRGVDSGMLCEIYLPA